MRAHELLTEIAAEDLLPRTFTEFRTKWLPQAHRDDLYVNFNDHVTGPDTKTFSPKPNHGDPVGLYAYPLEYVLNHPTDIVYGRQARYLRVIQDTSKNKVLLQTLDQQRAIDLLTRMGGVDVAARFKSLQTRMIKAGWAAGSAIDGKTFFRMMQWNLQPNQKTRLSNAEQTSVLRRAGIDALEDRGKGSQDAVIYADEPEQIVFLTRSAFRVIDSFTLRPAQAEALGQVNQAENLRRLPALIAQAIGDRIINIHADSNKSNEQTTYTAAKRKIVVRLHAQYSFQKGHRGGDDSTREPITIRILGPDFAPIVQEFTGDMSFADIATAMAERFKQRTPAAGASYDRDMEHGAAITAMMDLLRQVASKLKVTFDPPENPNVAHLVYGLISHLNRSPFPNNKKDYTTKTLIPTVEATLGKLTHRPIQADQIIAIWTAACKDRRIKPMLSRTLENFARDLGIESSAASPSKNAATDIREARDGVVIGRVGNSLRLRVEETTLEIAKLDNNKLEGWATPPAVIAASVIKAAGFIAQFLTKHSLYVEGYFEFLAKNYDLVFHDERWSTVETGATTVNLAHGIKAVTLVKDKDSSVVLLQRDAAVSDRAQDDNTVTTPHPRQQVILFWTRGKNITQLSVETQNWLRHLAREKKPKEERGWGETFPDSLGGRYSQGSAEDIPMWRGILASGFDLEEFIKKQGFHLSSALGDDLGLFGLLANKDNDKVGKTVSETLLSVGHYGDTEVFSFKGSHGSKLGGMRRFIVKVAGKLVEIARCDTDSYDGRSDTKVDWINPALTAEQKVTTSALLADKKLGIPVKMRPLLKPERSVKTKPAPAPPAK